MKNVKTLDKMKLMKEEYGSNPVVRCRDCCNCQRMPPKLQSYYCIAFGLMDGYDCSWNLEKIGGCGLFNRPFLNLRPRHIPLIEVYGQTGADDTSEQPLEQMMLF